MDREQIPLRFVSAAEVSLIWALQAADEQLGLASYGKGGTDLLIETPSDVWMLDRLMFSLRSKGFRITLAHPERSLLFQHDPSRLERLSEQGVLLPVNAGALLARRSPHGRLAERLCCEGLAQAMASDDHRGECWPPVTVLTAAVTWLTSVLGRERAEWMAAGAPAAIVAGSDLPPAAETQAPGRRWLTRRH